MTNKPDCCPSDLYEIYPEFNRAVGSVAGKLSNCIDSEIAQSFNQEADFEHCLSMVRKSRETLKDAHKQVKLGNLESARLLIEKADMEALEALPEVTEADKVLVDGKLAVLCRCGEQHTVDSPKDKVAYMCDNCSGIFEVNQFGQVSVSPLQDVVVCPMCGNSRFVKNVPLSTIRLDEFKTRKFNLRDVEI